MNYKILVKNVGRFYLTLAVPGLYFLILGIIASTPNSFPKFLLPVVFRLSIPISRYFWLLIALCGLLLWILCYFHLGKEFGVLPHKPKKVVKSGPYKYLKHPMYVGIFLAFTGLAMANLSIPGLLVNLLILTPVNIYRAQRESQAIGMI